MSGALIRALVPPGRARDKHGMRLAAAIGGVMRLALPPRCPGCGVVTGADHHFCAICWSGLRFLGSPACAGCGAPFPFDRGEGARCAPCLAAPPKHAGIRAAVAYGPVARTVARRLKYGGRTAFAETVARLMSRMVPPDSEIIVPVPLHRWRLWSRGFNQAALIAGALRTAAPVDRFVLVRHKATPLLRDLGKKARRRAVRTAFSVDPARAGAVRGRAVTLVDDIYTSGATTDACTAALLRAGARSVTILCWARVLDAAD